MTLCIVDESGGENLAPYCAASEIWEEWITFTTQTSDNLLDSES